MDQQHGTSNHNEFPSHDPSFHEDLTRFEFDTATNTWRAMAKQYTVEQLAVLPCDYRKGWISSPPDLHLLLRMTTKKALYCWGTMVICGELSVG